MSVQSSAALKDTQSLADARNIRIDGAGIRGIRHPVTIRTRLGEMQTVASFAMTVGLSPAVKGTHMSRFVALLEERSAALDPREFRALVQQMLARLGAESGAIEMTFPYFLRKTAPVSGIASLLDHEVSWTGEISRGGLYAFWAEVRVPVTSLCPCSKAISNYGAHNQRSEVRIKARLSGCMGVEELIAIAEAAASCEVYGLLKRADEKYVTEKAYDNPKFVEDLVRDVALALDGDVRVAEYAVEVENFESIHNHSTFARVARSKAA